MISGARKHWPIVQFKNVVAHSAFGPRFSGDLYSEAGNVATLRTTDLSPSGEISYSSMPLAQIDENKFANHFLQTGDLVISRSGRIGTTAVFNRFELPVLPGAFLIRFRLCNNALPEFYRYFFNSPAGQALIQSVARGAAQLNINISNLELLNIPLPARREQEEIVEILSGYDDLIENNRRRIVLLEEAARLLYREWFIHFRFPGHKRVKVIDGIPEGWKKLSLGEIARIRKGKNITKATVQEGDVPVVAAGLKPAYYHSEANALCPVITVSASGANAGYVALYHTDIWASDCSYLSAAENREIWFLYLSMKSRQTEITGMQQGAAQPHVYPKHLARLILVIPPANLLELFHERVDASFIQIANLDQQNQKLAKARDLLLPRLISGEIAV